MNEYYKDLFNPIMKKFKGGDKSSVIKQNAQDECVSLENSNPNFDIS